MVIPDQVTNHALRFRFTHYRSPRLATMLEIAKQGQYEEPPIPLAPGVWHHTAFNLSDRSQAQAALTLAELLVRHPCAEAYSRDIRIGMSAVCMVLRCYEKSFGSVDSRAYCWVRHTLVDDVLQQISFPVNITLGCGGVTAEREPPAPPPRLWFWPCRCAVGQASSITTKHPATLRHQVEAGLASAQVGWCPHLQRLDEWDLYQWGKE